MLGGWQCATTHDVWRGPAISLRDCHRAFKEAEKPKNVILLSPVLKVPQEVEKEMAIVDFALPGREELRTLIHNLCADVGLEHTVEDLDTYTEAALEVAALRP